MIHASCSGSPSASKTLPPKRCSSVTVPRRPVGLPRAHRLGPHLRAALVRHARLAGERDDVVERRLVLAADGGPEVGLAVGLRLADLALDGEALGGLGEPAGERVGRAARGTRRARRGSGESSRCSSSTACVHAVTAYEHSMIIGGRISRCAVGAVLAPVGRAELVRLAQVVEEEVDRRARELARPVARRRVERDLDAVEAVPGRARA